MARRAIEVGLRFAGDAAALWRTCGPAVAARWVGSVAAHLPACLRTGSLSAADDAMGEGPFTARLGGARARLVGPGVIGGIREIWARDSYLGEGFLRISNADVVVDLGANVGHFSTLALAHGPQVRVVAVEANPEFRDPFEGNLEVNGWQGRADLLNVFIGGTTATQRTMRLRPEVSAIPMWSQEDFIRNSRLERIDFLKCDIEGSEFSLFEGQSPLLAMARQLGIEIHKAAGDAEALLAILRNGGFETKTVQEDADGMVVLARRRT